MPGQSNPGLTAIAFISSQNHPILVRARSSSPEDLLKYHYVAHTSLDVIDERSKQHPTVTSFDL
jgi:trafficking protein particle complex subunit 2